MRLAELSERSGVATATIKYYLREGLLAPGRQINATTGEYDEEHLRRLRLVRALIQVGRLPVATVREVLGHVDDDSLGRTIRMGAALWALPQVPEPDVED
jgi:DNA-binding transcriptional MerR regulator